MLPVVRSGDETETILTDVLGKVASSPFHQTYLSSWISGKEKEVKLLSTYLEYLKDVQLVLSLEDLDSVVDSLEYDQVVCFSLLPVSDQDDIAEQMYVFLRSGSWEPGRLATKRWFENPEIINDIKSKARIFRGFANENGRDENTKFIFTNIHRITDEKVVTIHLYEDGHATELEPPGKPEKPYAKKKSDSSITLEWKESPTGVSSVQKYTAHFRLAVSDSNGESGGEWTSSQTEGPENVITVDGLEAKTAYVFKVNSVSKAGRSVMSDISDRIVTKEPVALPQTGGSSTESDPLQDEEQDYAPYFESNGDGVCHNTTLTSTSTSSNDVKSPVINKDIDPRNELHKQHTAERNGPHKHYKALNSNGTAFFVPYRLADFMVSSSKKIATESPSVYKLPARVIMRRENSMIARQTIGRPRRIAGLLPEKVLMVVGVTGAGKTTLINGMVNYTLVVQRKDHFRFKLIVEDSGVSQANSQTKSITAYTFHPMEGSTIPYKFPIVNTPGFGDTEGLRRDKAITNQIKEFFFIPYKWYRSPRWHWFRNSSVPGAPYSTTRVHL